MAHGGGPTWLTGTYDPQLDTLYWDTGNPAKEIDGADRPGDNLYTNTLLALDPKTAREEREAKEAAANVPPELNPPFPYTRLSFDVFFFHVEGPPPKKPEVAG